MTLTDIRSRTLDRRLPAPVEPAANNRLDIVLLREQYRSLVRFAPFLYGFVMLAAMMLAMAERHSASPLWTFAVPAVLVVALGARSAYWLKARRRVESRAEAVMRRDLRIALVVGPALTFGLSLAAAASLPPDNAVERALALFGLWAAA